MEASVIISLVIGIISGTALITERLLNLRNLYLKNRIVRDRLLNELWNDNDPERINLVCKYYHNLILKYPT